MSQKPIVLSTAEMLLFKKLKEQRDREKARRQARNQRPDVKLKNALAHEKYAKRNRAFAFAFRYLFENSLLSDELMDKIHQNVPEFVDYLNEATDEQAVKADELNEDDDERDEGDEGDSEDAN